MESREATHAGEIFQTVLWRTRTLGFPPSPHFKTAFAFMGTNGMLYHDGATCKDYDDIPIKTAAINNTQNAVLLCDSQKFSSGAIMEYAKWEDFSCLITDADVSEEIKTRIRAKTKLILA